MKTTITLIIALVAGLVIGWFAGQHRHGNTASLQTQSIEAQAKEVAERTHQSAKWSALWSLEEDDLKELAAAMKIPDDVSKMNAKSALKDPTMKSYSPYFHFKYTYELMRQTVQKQQNTNP